MSLTILRRPFTWQRRPLGAAGVGWIALATSMLSASTFNAFGKTLSSALTPLSLVFISEILVLLFVVLSFGLVPILRAYAKLDRRSLLILLAMGCLSGVVGPSLWFTGLSLTTAVNANFFGRAELVFVLLIAAFFLHEKLSRVHLLAAGSILAGLGIIALRGFTASVEPELGDLLIILATVGFATGNALYSKYLHHVPPHLALCSRSIIAVSAFFLTIPFLPHSLAGEIALFPMALLPALVGFGFISRFINSVAFYEAIERLPMSTISLVGSLDVILATVVAYAMLGEPIAWYHVLGGGFIILGTLLLELTHRHPIARVEEQRQLRQRLP